MAVTVFRRLPRIGRPVEIAAIADEEPAIRQRSMNAGDTQCLRSHRGAAFTRPTVGGDTDEARLTPRDAAHAGTLSRTRRAMRVAIPAKRFFGSARSGTRSMLSLSVARARCRRCR